MFCDYCGQEVAFQEQEGGEEIVEYDLASGLSLSQDGFGDQVRRSSCQDCGASVCFGQSVTATICDFCGSNQVLQISELRRAIRPESLVPFQIDKDQSAKAFKEWIGGLWFRPNDLKHRAKVSEIGGVYVPYWTFDATVDSDWTADAGYYYYVTETYTTTENGETVTKTRSVRKTRWVPAWGSREDAFDDVLVCASGVRQVPPTGAQTVVCEKCGFKLDVGSPVLSCQGCAAQVSPPKGVQEFSCPYCRVNIRIIGLRT